MKNLTQQDIDDYLNSLEPIKNDRMIIHTGHGGAIIYLRECFKQFGITHTDEELEETLATLPKDNMFGITKYETNNTLSYKIG